CPFEQRVARRVREIGEDNRVLVREFWRVVKIQVACCDERQHSGSRSNHLPPLRDGGCGSGLPARCQPHPIPVPLQALEVGASLRSVLVAEAPVLLQALDNDTVQLYRDRGVKADRTNWTLVQDGIEDGPNRVAAERRSPGGHLIEHYSVGEQI